MEKLKEDKPELKEENFIEQENNYRTEEMSELELTAWEKVKLARITDRPTAKDYIEYLFTDFIELSGDRNFRDDKAIIGGIAKLAGTPVTVIAQQKGRSTEENLYRNFGMVHPEGYRKALRLMKQAEKFNRPIIMLVDTPGAYPGIGAEERGQSQAIAENLFELSKLKVPTITVIIGEGGSGGALALAVSDVVIMLEYSIYSILSPEGFASILWKDAAKAPEAAQIMRLTAIELLELSIIDDIVAEPYGGIQNNPKVVFEDLQTKLVNNLEILSKLNKKNLINQRYKKIRKLGEYV